MRPASYIHSLTVLCAATAMSLGAASPPQAESRRLELAGFARTQLDLPADSPPSARISIQLAETDHVLEVRRHSMRADDFRVLVQGGDGRLTPVEPPPVTTYRGVVAGQPDSRVFGSLYHGQLRATVELESGDVWHIQPSADFEPAAPAGEHRIYRDEDVLPHGFRCGVDDLGLQPAAIDDRHGNGGGIAGTGNKTCDIACDADFEFYQQNGSSVTNTVLDIENILNRMETIYDGEADIVYETTVIVVRSTSADPYTSTDPGALLGEFQNHWNTHADLGADVRRDTAELFTGKNLNGSVIGVAYLGTICSSLTAGVGYSVVQSRFTTNLIQRTCLSAHEVGHSWNAGHCDGQPDCGIMCSGLGGCTGSCTTFGNQETTQITTFRNSRTCLLDEFDPLPIPFSDTFPDGTVDPVKWSYVRRANALNSAVNPPTPPYALNLDSPGAGLFEDDEVRSNFLLLAGTGNVYLSYYVQHVGVESGETLTVQYWNNALAWVTLNTITSNGVDDAGFTLHSHLLPNAAKHNEFRVRFRADVNGPDDDWYVDNVLVELGAAPAISQQPTPQTACVGQSASFTVTASGSPPPTYRWRKNGSNLSDGGNISGAATPTLVINPVGPGDTGNYDVAVTNPVGSTTSNAAALTVATAPSITTHPANQAVNEGDPASFSVAATGTAPLSYQWRFNGSDLTNGGSISGATTANLTINPTAAGHAGSYDVVVTNNCGSATSNPATLTVTGGGCEPCDTNCDGSVNPFDIQDFVNALSPSPPSPCSPCAGDANGDGSVNAFDINAFVDCLEG